MRIRKLDTESKRDVSCFTAFPYDLYRDCEHWVPPLRSDIFHALDRRRHPFYEHSTADFFVVESEGQVLGRVAALENRNYNRYHRTRTAFFGYFEAVDDAEVATYLLETAVAWAKAHNLETIIGPRGLIGIDGTVLVDGFEHPPALSVPYNPPYYDHIIKQAGFDKDTDYLSGYLPGNHTLSPRILSIAQKVQARRGFWIKTFKSKQEIRLWLPCALEIHRRAMGGLHTYYPPTEREVRLVIDTLLLVADPRLVKLVMKDDEVAGFILAYPDVSEALKKMNGRLWPFGWLHFLRERRRTRRVNVNAVGLLPQHRGVGANTLLYAELARSIYANGYEHVDIVQVEENNARSLADMENIGVRWDRRHRHYRCALAATAM